MRKITLLKPFLLFSLLAVLLTLAACNTSVSNNSPALEPKKYAIWLDQSSYTEFKKIFKTSLKDGFYMWQEFDVAQWDILSKSLTDKGKYMWTESNIRDWLKKEGLSDDQATQQVEWLTTHDHGFIAIRDDDTVDYLFK